MQGAQPAPECMEGVSIALMEVRRREIAAAAKPFVAVHLHFPLTMM